MLDIKFIRENSDKVKEACANKNINGGDTIVDQLLDLDIKKRSLMTTLENLRATQNKFTKSASAKSSGETMNNIEEAKKNKLEIKTLEPDLQETENKFNELLMKLPNIPFDDVPVGKDDSENVVLRQIGSLPKFNFIPKEHFQIGEELNIIDIERASTVAGSRFYFLKNEAALLEMALVNFAFSKLAKKGFSPVIPPVMIQPKLASGMGYIENHPDEESYYLERDNLYLTATSEQSLGAMHHREILDQLPKKYVAFSTCFRRESGSYGKDTKGIFRVHQFDKMEMFVFSKPEDSEKEHQNLLAIEEELMKDLKIPYQVINICTGDLGKSAARKYDIEAWMPGQNRYRETHSTSNCTDYQARGINIKYKDQKNNLNFVHTLNGTAFAMGRIIVAILENNQQKDGSVKIPKVLQKYTRFKVIKLKKILK
ncbi:MAG: serine--tRNA ligase [Candidatus Staskawiczbacteria bacterium RIFCSPHIGHO2_02_FULL_33_16]|uniref:Serine--tRNA ligase n=1 Tax=Candidatus Staskawiczbacteria bacterium RIFCSPHIGHO2_02_FULL_33_16 TaxID=1802204 RepID=A0A1G2HZL9_9BACT|nr:MAG: serine--tRNA ligase [Candidatus Staskawiczbacteria bacterium RIFCSPHIGHO2_02_FULL_33_16]OGZ70346.1 MAG: serine--tRNA ligase [Candidatus Staskawiczbacteria bacterium RIFCSPLOWO2_01_FULL_33_13]